MNTWRVRKLAPWEQFDASARYAPWVVERAVYGRWEQFDRGPSHRSAIRSADRLARR